MNSLKDSLVKDIDAHKTSQTQSQRTVLTSFRSKITENAISPCPICYDRNPNSTNWIRAITVDFDGKISHQMWSVSHLPYRFEIPHFIEVGQLLGIGFKSYRGVFKERYLIVSSLTETKMELDLIAEWTPNFEEKELLKKWKAWEDNRPKSLQQEPFKKLTKKQRRQLQRENRELNNQYRTQMLNDLTL